MALDYTLFASNPYGVLATPLDYGVEDAPTSKTYHGITLEVDGFVLGRIQSWHPSGAYTREGEHVYELSNLSWGLPVDYVPGRATGFSVTATAAELWTKEIEIQLGLSAVQFNNLIEQNRPFTAREYWFRGIDTYQIWTYRGCWLTDRNEEAFSADGNARVIANFTFNYISRQRSSGGGSGGASLPG